MEKCRMKPNTLPIHSTPLLGAHSGSKRWLLTTSSHAIAANRDLLLSLALRVCERHF